MLIGVCGRTDKIFSTVGGKSAYRPSLWVFIELKPRRERFSCGRNFYSDTDLQWRLSFHKTIGPGERGEGGGDSLVFWQSTIQCGTGQCHFVTILSKRLQTHQYTSNNKSCSLWQMCLFRLSACLLRTRTLDTPCVVDKAACWYESMYIYLSCKDMRYGRQTFEHVIDTLGVTQANRDGMSFVFVFFYAPAWWIDSNIECYKTFWWDILNGIWCSIPSLCVGVLVVYSWV